jgi:AcrR family transcriptional regulator
VATQHERRATTRSAIVQAARGCFAAKGFHETSIDDIQNAAGVSRGAFYHHFESKAAVFEAVYLDVSASAIRRAGTAEPSAGSTPFDALVHGCMAWLDIVAEPTVGRILLIEGPTALGWHRARELDEALSLGPMRVLLRAAARSGEITRDVSDLTARLINALLAEAALLLQGATPARRRQVRAHVSAMIGGLRSNAPE